MTSFYQLTFLTFGHLNLDLKLTEPKLTLQLNIPLHSISLQTRFILELSGDNSSETLLLILCLLDQSQDF